MDPGAPPAGRPPLTVFATLKPLRGRARLVQRNAVLSWTLLRPRPEVILFGDEEGVAELCAELGVRHVPEVARSRFGTPLVSDLFGQARRLAQTDLLCYANADIVLTSGFMDAVRTLARWRGRRPFLATGSRWNVEVDEPIDPDRPWERELLDAAARSTSTGGGFALDYFVFTPELYEVVPPFAVARPHWDTWMVYGALRRGAPVIDLSPAFRAIHQAHDAPRRPPGGDWSYPEETRRNRDLAAGAIPDLPASGFGLEDATHVLTGEGIRPAWRVRGGWRYAQRKVTRLPALHPRLDPPIRISRRLAARIRFAVLRSRVSDVAGRVRGRRVLHCIGDRQAEVFGTVRSKHLLPATWIDLSLEPSLRAASLDGAASAPSDRIRRLVDGLPGGRAILVMVGAEDCSAQIDEDGLAGAADRYTSFLQELLARGRRDLVIAAVPPPLHEDDAASDPELAGKMRLTASFNARLREWCAERGCRFLDYEADVLDPETGLVRDEFRLHGQRELNLDPGPWSEVLALRLRAMGF